MCKCFGAGSTQGSWSHFCHFIKLTSLWVMLLQVRLYWGGKQKTKLKFRQNGIPKSRDKQDLLIRALPSLQKIIFCLQFCSINLGLLHELCASRRLQSSGTSSACQWGTETLLGSDMGVSLAGTAALLISSPLQLLTDSIPSLNELLVDKKNSFCTP